MWVKLVDNSKFSNLKHEQLNLVKKVILIKLTQFCLTKGPTGRKSHAGHPKLAVWQSVAETRSRPVYSHRQVLGLDMTKSVWLRKDKTNDAPMNRELELWCDLLSHSLETIMHLGKSDDSSVWFLDKTMNMNMLLLAFH